MTKELDEKLVNTYPKIFANRYGDMKTTCMCWGFSCGNGWYWLIDKLCSQLQWNTDHNNSGSNEGKNPQIVASQVKEKFGGLRFYVEGATSEQHAIISWAESLSYGICETCGSTKDVHQTEGWVYTECPDCRFKRENKMTREPYIFWLFISPKSSWWTRKYILKKIYYKIRKSISSIHNKVLISLTTFKR
jgi:DNA-directed RNA polymerase subunit RPC12/RpoP